MDEDTWGYCHFCGTEVSPVEPDAEETSCETCNSKVKVEALGTVGFVWLRLVAPTLPVSSHVGDRT
jgi:DNA-directed RNA polymerase subunit RPC12/RpoP